jgi:hypothetical protein
LARLTNQPVSSQEPMMMAAPIGQPMVSTLPSDGVQELGCKDTSSMIP